jgi:hypothetical protein
LTPPWKPDIKSDWDTKYIPEEFSNEPVQLTPPENDRQAAALDNSGELPYFEKFSYHGSKGSLGSYLGTSSMSTTTTFE